MSEEKKPFTVSDRRHFTPEGRARASEGEQSSSREASVGPEAREPARPEARRVAPAEPAVGAPPADFVGLLISLGAQAAYLLGQGRPEDESGESDPEGARAFIDLLEILKDKTEGRRTPEEDQVLGSLLFQLRMEYVARTRGAGA